MTPAKKAAPTKKAAAKKAAPPAPPSPPELEEHGPPAPAPEGPPDASPRAAPDASPPEGHDGIPPVELRCTTPGCENPGPYPDLRRLRMHEAEHQRRRCRYCQELYSPSGIGPHEAACQRRQLAAQVPPALEAVPRWLEGLAIPEAALERLVRFVTEAQEGDTLAAGYSIVVSASWGPHLVKAASLSTVCAGHRDAAVLVLDAGRVAHELTLEAELADLADLPTTGTGPA